MKHVCGRFAIRRLTSMQYQSKHVWKLVNTLHHNIVHTSILYFICVNTSIYIYISSPIVGSYIYLSVRFLTAFY